MTGAFLLARVGMDVRFRPEADVSLGAFDPGHCGTQNLALTNLLVVIASMRRAIHEVGAFAAAALAGASTLVFCVGYGFWILFPLSVSLYVGVTTVAVVAAGLVTWMAVRRGFQLPAPSRGMIIVFVLGYSGLQSGLAALGTLKIQADYMRSLTSQHPPRS